MEEWDEAPESIAEDTLYFDWSESETTAGCVIERDDYTEIRGMPDDNFYAVEQALGDNGIPCGGAQDEETGRWVIVCYPCPALTDTVREAMRSTEHFGDCYRAAGQAVFGDETLTLCHGYANAKDGARIGHAWCERDGTCFDFTCGQRKVMPRDAYYGLHGIKPEEVIRYTQKEAASRALEANEWNGWDLDLDETGKKRT